jgi:hypothetical protein
VSLFFRGEVGNALILAYRGWATIWVIFHKLIWSPCSVWPDRAKFRHLGNIYTKLNLTRNFFVKSSDIFKSVILIFGEIFHKLIWSPCSVWPDCAKFRHFGTIFRKLILTRNEVPYILC